MNTAVNAAGAPRAGDGREEGNNPSATVVVVCYNEQNRIPGCLDSIFAQDFNEAWELIVIDNCSTDDTAAVVSEKMHGHGNARLVRNDNKSLSSGRNAGMRAASAPLVAYTDADCVVPPHWLRGLVACYRERKAIDPSLVGLGGGNYQPDSTPFYQALRIFLQSPLGNRGSTQTERYGEGRYVDSLASLNVLYEREALLAIGGYDETNFPRVGEDEDLNSRLGALGRRIYYVPDCAVLHYWRDSFRGWCRNMYIYGYGRAKLRERHPERRRMTDLLCLAVPLAVVLALLAPIFWPLALPLAGYLGVVFLVSAAGVARAGKPFLLPRVFSLLLGTHWFYALGIIRGWL